MGRFERITKVDTPYIPVDLDQSKPKMLMYQQLKDEQDRLDKISELDAQTKLKNAELLSKIRPEYYSKANELFNNYLEQRTQQVLGAKDNLSLTQALNSSASFLSNPAFQRMLQDSEIKNNAIEQAKQIEAKGGTSNIFNQQLLSQSDYDNYTTIDSKGNPVKVSIDQLRVSELQDFQNHMADFGKKVAEANAFSTTRLDRYGNLVTQSGEILSNSKLENIANTTFDAYLGSDAGKAQMNLLTNSSERNPIPLTTEEAKLKIKQQYKNVLKSLAYNKSSYSEQPSRLAIEEAKGRTKANRESEFKVPVYTSPNTTSTGSRWSDDKSSIVTGLVSGNKPNIPISLTIDRGYQVGGRPLFGQYGNPIKEPVQFKGTLDGYETKFVIDEVEKNGKPDEYQTKELKGKLATTGSDGTLSDADLDLKPEIDKQTGKPYIQHNGYKFYLKERAFAKLTSEDGKETFLKPITRGESNAYLGKNFTETTPIELKPINTQSGQAYKTVFENTPDIQIKVNSAIDYISQNGLFDDKETQAYIDYINKGNGLLDTPAKKSAFDKINYVIEQLEKQEALNNFRLKKDQEYFQKDFELE